MKAAPGEDSAPEPPRRDMRRHACGAALLLILAAAVGLRVYRLEHESAFYDEVASIVVLDAPDLATFFQTYRLSGDIVSPPAYLTAEYLWAHTAGASVHSIRLLSVLFGVLSILFVYLVASELFGQPTGLLSAGVAAVSMTHIYYSQEIRAYALAMMLSGLSAYSFVKLLHRGGRRWWLLHLAVNALLPLTHLMAAFMLLAEGLALLALRWRRPGRIIAWGMANACACLPVLLWLVTLDLGFADRSTSWVPDLSPLAFLGALPFFAGAWTRWSLMGRYATYSPLDTAATVALAAVAYAALVWAVWWALSAGRSTHSGHGDATRLSGGGGMLFILAWLLVPPLALLALSYLWRPCYVERYVLYSALPFAIVLGAAVGQASKRPAQLAVAALLVVLYAHSLARVGGPLRPDWQGVAQHVHDRGLEGDLVFIRPFWQRDSFRFYSELPDAQIQPFDDWSVVYRRAPEALAAGHALWAVVFPLGEDLAEFEHGLSTRGLRYDKTVSNGLIRPLVYHITAPGPGG